MKNKNIKYVFIPAFVATTLFPFLANENEVFASDNEMHPTSRINNNADNDRKLSISEPFDNSITKVSTSFNNTGLNNNDSNIGNTEVKPKAFLETENKIKYEDAVPSIAPVASVLNPFTGKIDSLSINGNKVLIDNDGNVSEFNTPSDAPVAEAPKPFTGKVDGLSENSNKVVVDKDGNVSEFNTPTDSPVVEALKPFTGNVNELSENGNKVIVDKDGNVVEISKSSEAPIVTELPKLNINNDSVTVTIKSKDKNITVDLNPVDAKDISFESKDITDTINLEDLKNKIIADVNNNIKDKKDITSIRVIDLELQKDDNEVKLNVPRTVHIALLQNEQDKEILVYHIKEDNSIELVPSNVTSDNLHFTVNHFSKFAIIAKIKTALASNEKDINTSAVQEEKKFTVIETRGAKSAPTNAPKTLPKTGISINNFFVTLGISLLALSVFLKRRINK